jgi:hypothetical protein
MKNLTKETILQRVNSLCPLKKKDFSNVVFGEAFSWSSPIKISQHVLDFCLLADIEK